MKLSSSLIILIAASAMLPTSVEGKHRKKKESKKDESSEEMDDLMSNSTVVDSLVVVEADTSEEESTATSPASATTSSKSSKSIRFQTCNIANPPYEQAKLITNTPSMTINQFLESDLVGVGGEGYLAWHSTAVYTDFVQWVERWVDSPSDETKDLIEIAGAATGSLHNSLSLSATTQCEMLHALVGQMQTSCHYNNRSRKVYVDVASAYMTGFNFAAGDAEKKEEFVEFCDLESLWE